MNWLASIQERYEVNPWVFALIYLVTLPPGWLFETFENDDESEESEAETRA